MRPAGHNGKAVLRSYFSDFAAQKLELFAGVTGVQMNVGDYFNLGLKHFAHGLASSGPVRGFEQCIGCSDCDFQAGRVRKEILLLDSEGVFRCLFLLGRRSDDQLPFVAAQVETKQFKNFGVKLHELASMLRVGPPATVVSAPWGSSLLPAPATYDL